MTVMPLAEARNHLSEVIDEIDQTHDRVTITRHGKAIAVLISPDDLASMEETLAILATPGAAEAIDEGERDLAAGRVVPWESLRSRLLPPK